MSKKLPLLGAHMSVAGGLYKACERGHEVGINALQIFTKNDRQWKAKPLTNEMTDAFKNSEKEAGIKVSFAHDTYLHNLATVDETLRKKSMDGFTHEMERCEALGLSYLISHPGAPKDAGEEAGLKNMIRSLDEIVERTKGFQTLALLETTAGQGTVLGWNFDQLRVIREGLKSPERLGFCVDTCHIFAAGYDIRTKKGWDKTFKEWDEKLGIDSIKAFHVNDSKKGLGSRVDRHEHIGQGHIGIEAFRCLMNDRRFRDVPKVLETPKVGNMDHENLEKLRSLVK
jgi:deoxyribonuclease-4